MLTWPSAPRSTSSAEGIDHHRPRRARRRALGSMAGLYAALLAALSPWHLYLSQFARYYTLLFCDAVLVYTLLPRALDQDSPRLYLLCAGLLTLGALTHPSLGFPMVGVLVALQMVSRSGGLGWAWPTRRAWLWLWL